MFEVIMFGLFCLILGIISGALILFFVFRNNPTLLAAWVTEMAKAAAIETGLANEMKKL